MGFPGFEIRHKGKRSSWALGYYPALKEVSLFPREDGSGLTLNPGYDFKVDPDWAKLERIYEFARAADLVDLSALRVIEFLREQELNDAKAE
jgi:hypothetical protein